MFHAAISKAYPKLKIVATTIPVPDQGLTVSILDPAEQYSDRYVDACSLVEVGGSRTSDLFCFARHIYTTPDIFASLGDRYELFSSLRQDLSSDVPNVL